MIYRACRYHKMGKELSCLVSELVTYRGYLPQGAPTSTTIANLVFKPIDEILERYCGKSNITYTRYIDDMTFSSEHDFQDKVSNIIHIISKTGFMLSRKKIAYKIGSATITGVEVKNNVLEASKNNINKLISNLIDDDGSLQNKIIGQTSYRSSVRKHNE